jgi:NADPH-dependent 2,4-dienoyl-CoA reductase/sulfur reductase-like enzyme
MIKPRDIIVIGGNAAGPAAAAKAKRVAPYANVVMFEAGNFISTGTCELPYVLSGDIKDYSEIVFFDPSKFENEKGVKVFVNHFVEKINRRDKTIVVKDLKSQSTFEKKYDKLIIATGSRAKKIPALTSNLKNVFTLKSISDLIKIQSYLHNKSLKNILIIGSGYIGLETADALNKLGLNVTIFDKEEKPLPDADDEIRNLILDLIEKNKIQFYGGTSDIKFITKDDAIISVKVEGRILDFDLIITAVGFEPNNDLAVAAKLETCKFGGIKVNTKLQTSDPNIFAAGDNIEIVNKITGQNDYIPLATLAHRFGHIAGENAAGGNVFSSAVVKNIGVKLFDNYYASVGINSSQASFNKYNFGSVTAVVPNLVKVMPQSQNVFGKILFDKNTKLILGAFFLGGKEIAGYSDLVASFINNKIKTDELSKINYNYTPPLSPFVNLLSVLGRKINTE